MVRARVRARLRAVHRPGGPPDPAGVAPLELDHGAVDCLRGLGLGLGFMPSTVRARVRVNAVRVVDRLLGLGLGLGFMPLTVRVQVNAVGR